MTNWENSFKEIYDRGIDAYRNGERDPDAMFAGDDRAFLASIGCRPRELFDFVEDRVNYGEPDYQTVRDVTELRYRYFTEVQGGTPSGRVIDSSKLPPKSEAIDGIRWLPRIIEKARAKLRGELDEDTMYGCGGDRPFLAGVNMTLPGFLKLVWEAEGDRRRIVEGVKRAGAVISDQ